MSLARRLKSSRRPKLPMLWKGPEKDGITQSMLNAYLFCKERFYVEYIEGLTAKDEYLAKLEYGHMWHVCEEKHAAGKPWKPALNRYAADLCEVHRTAQREIVKWRNVCAAQFPEYVKFYRNDKSTKERVFLDKEWTFSVPYALPSGRTVVLRGKIDSLDKVGKSLIVQENKTTGDPNIARVEHKLRFDLQTGIYLVAAYYRFPKIKNLGVRYNVVRRPLSGGRHSIRPHQATSKKPAETMDEFYKRLRGLIAGEPEFFFMRWDVDISQDDMQRFRHEFLTPVLENLCDDYEWWEDCYNKGIDRFDFEKRWGYDHVPRHYRLPYGLWHPIAENQITPYDDYLDLGLRSGLVRAKTLFGEL